MKPMEPEPQQHGTRATHVQELARRFNVRIPARQLAEIDAAERALLEFNHTNPLIEEALRRVFELNQGGIESWAITAGGLGPEFVAALDEHARLHRTLNDADRAARNRINAIARDREELARRREQAVEVGRAIVATIIRPLRFLVSQPRAGRDRHMGTRPAMASAGGGDDSSSSPDPPPAGPHQLGALHLDNLKLLSVAVLALASGFVLGAILAAVVPQLVSK